MRTSTDVLSLKVHGYKVSSVVFSTDGTQIVSGSEDGTVKVWDAHTGADILSHKGHLAAVTSVAITVDGKRIVTRALFSMRPSGRWHSHGQWR